MQSEDSFHFKSTLEVSTNRLWGCHFAVPPLVAEALIAQTTDRRVICTLNGKKEFQCALLPRGDGTFVITVNKKLQTALAAKPGMQVDVTLRKDESEYGLPMPEELEEVLRQDEEGNRLFHALPPGKLRTLLYIAGNVKNPDARLTRALVIVEHLKEQQGKIDYKRLHSALQDAAKR